MPNMQRSRFALVSERHGTFRLAAGINEVGRDGAATVVLTDRSISQRHAALEVLEDSVLVRDLASKNGTFVNSAPATATHAKPGDQIRFGRFSFDLELIDPEDGWLAVTARPQDKPPTHSVSAHSTVVTQTQEWEVEIQRLRAFVEEITSSTASGEHSSTLATLRRELGAESAVLLRQDDSHAVHVLAAAGSLELDPSDIEEILNQCAAHETSRATVSVRIGDLSYGVAVRSVSGCRLTLIAPGGWSSDSTGGWLISTALAVIALGLDLKPAEKRTSGPVARLVFPKDHVHCVSSAMARLYEDVRAAAGSDLPALIQGETGVGKESIAAILHRSSPRSDSRLVTINCAAIPSDLLEAELFGIASGTATGVAPRSGRLEGANGGTVLLDEIGDMDIVLQAKLLRVLEQGTVEPVGGSARALDIRVVASTNRDLRHDITTGRFRADLYYRLSGFVLEVPALKQRTSDIPLLIEHFFEEASREAGNAVRGITYGALKKLTERDWPGNVRELRHAVFRAVAETVEGGIIDSRRIQRIDRPDEPTSAEDSSHGLPSLCLSELERRAIHAALDRTRGNQTAAAKILGISRGALRRKVARHDS